MIMEKRLAALNQWLSDCGITNYKLIPLAHDASFRRYFRIILQEATYIVMDAPPRLESCHAFMALSKALTHQGIDVPAVYHSDIAQGFLLITDFGDKQLLKELTHQNVESYYTAALQTLRKLQACTSDEAHSLPIFSAEFIVQELHLAKEWFFQRHLDLTLSSEHHAILNEFFNYLAESASKQPQVFMHRDYHAGNLMVLPQSIGVLDFQDAFMGPITYDLVSLLKDCYIDWPEPLVQKLALQFKTAQMIEVEDKEFLRWFDLMGMQRHLKALLTFSRKFYRDNNPNYLQYMPRTFNYLLTTAQRLPAVGDFHRFLKTIAAPAFKGSVLSCTP